MDGVISWIQVVVLAADIEPAQVAGRRVLHDVRPEGLAVAHGHRVSVLQGAQRNRRGLGPAQHNRHPLGPEAVGQPVRLGLPGGAHADAHEIRRLLQPAGG